MFGRTRETRAHAAQRKAEDAWHQLVDAMENAGGAARSAGRRTQRAATHAGSSASTVAGEARRRASAAMDALAGRGPRTRWEWIAGAVVAGLVVGWAAAAGARKAVDAGRDALSDDPERARELASAETMDVSASPQR